MYILSEYLRILERKEVHIVYIRKSFYGLFLSSSTQAALMQEKTQENTGEL